MLTKPDWEIMYRAQEADLAELRQRAEKAEAERERLRKELEGVERLRGIVQESLRKTGHYAVKDIPDELFERLPCLVAKLRAENNKLRSFIAGSELDCIYCGLPMKDLAKCASGFPGCSRADDMLCTPEPLEEVCGE